MTLDKLELIGFQEKNRALLLLKSLGSGLEMLHFRKFEDAADGSALYPDNRKPWHWANLPISNVFRNGRHEVAPTKKVSKTSPMNWATTVGFLWAV